MKIIFSLTFTLVYFSTIAQLDLDGFKFKGKLKSTNQTHYYFNNDTVISISSYNSIYNKDGLLLKTTYFHTAKDSIDYGAVHYYSYDSLNRLISCTANDSSFISYNKYVNKRDTSRILYVSSYLNGNLANATIIKFNSKEEKLEYRRFDSVNSIYEYEYYKYKYFKKGRLREHYTYNANSGNLIRFGKSYTSVDGLRVETEYTDYVKNYSGKHLNVYDINKNLVSFTSYYKNGKSTTTTYEYSNIDKNGNWLAKKSYSEGKLHYKIEREIEYW